MSAQDFVLDASVTLVWCFKDEDVDFAEQILERLAQAEAFVPTLWLLEVANVLALAERHNRLTQAESSHFLNLLQSLPISIQETPRPFIWGDTLALARSHTLSVYDSAYLNLAMKLGLPLATLDKNLRAAALRCGVNLL